ncbi:excinuclease ABC subunit UvrB [Helicobacter suis]|uniref:excinuclease ABC subunit UvrB n=1 Tax=Helicobacter suis TaxID=104628 RepID=UPI0002E1EB5B|nr:excinuclease ABC subunit UvrB [Helicobacter suis]BCD46894.1 Excinuclease ABC subunit B UvrB [Helicobacter suis]BCD48652.1 Excinuclease ABC subunit B UvrB [Helicobacter suis]BCD50428.1 Excinuclease ABC subunit B UvrB [Helicobacter suis]BDR27346.1 UvrABC system protein B [Helicobacter suis HS1]GFK16210.1 Excinuclease ABC subunit B UvrB [Helicobacter suis]
MGFILNAPYKASLEQEQAVQKLQEGINLNAKYQTLVGVTGSGKTFSMAYLISKLQMPTLVMSHNKTLCAQLYSEFKSFFPKNHVEYFISHFDYYQPESYIPRRDLFIEKDSSINEDLERLRLSAITSLLGYDDVVVVASVSANYGLGNPAEYLSMLEKIEVGQQISYTQFLLKLVEMGYERQDILERGYFRVVGESVDIFPAYNDSNFIRVEFFGDEVDRITYMDALENTPIQSLDSYILYAASAFIVSPQCLKKALSSIETELAQRLEFFKQEQKLLEYERLKTRTEFDLEMMGTTGICKGIENYSRHFTGKQAGETPYTLMDYFAQKNCPYLVIVDESHVSLPQFKGMYAGDLSRKQVLVEHGFRLPSALDNRPLKYEEFIQKAPHFLFVSATPNPLELELSGNHVASQIIRPTGLLDPEYCLRPTQNQVNDLLKTIQSVVAKKERVLVTTLTKRMAEELCKHYAECGLKVQYLHSDTDVIARNHSIRALRLGEIDVLIGINLLREGLDLPEVSLVAILDADKEGFLRSSTALIQTMGRAARHVHGRVIFYADKITPSMQEAMDITDSRRAKQMAFNQEHGLTPRGVNRPLEAELKEIELSKPSKKNLNKMPKSEKERLIKTLRAQMQERARVLDFENAAKLRDEIARIRGL